MSNKNKSVIEPFSTKFAISYSFAQITDVIGYYMFTFLIFTFYYAVVGLNVNWITFGFIIWSIWNAINDPLIGALSDRTNTRWGRRLPYVLVGIVPFCIIMILLWTPPTTSDIQSFIYFIFIIILFDTSYTCYSMGQAAMFPELFKNLEERAKANNIRQIFTVLGLVVGFIMPTFFIPKLDDPKYFINYSYVGIIAAITMAIFAFLFIKFGTRQTPEFSEDYKAAPAFFKSLKISLKNKSFRWYIICHFANWYVYGMLPTIMPLYSIFVLKIGEGESLLIGLLLALTFISAMIFIPLWKFVALKIGARKGIMISMSVFIITLIPFLFVSDVIIAFFIFFFVGLGLSGSFFFLDLLSSAVIDEDELDTKIRRTGGYLGISTFFLRFATIFVFISIGLVFNSTGWAIFDPIGTADTELGLRLLMFLFPSIALGFGLLSMIKFPITKDKYAEIKQAIEKLHKEKIEKIK